MEFHFSYEQHIQLRFLVTKQKLVLGVQMCMITLARDEFYMSFNLTFLSSAIAINLFGPSLLFVWYGLSLIELNQGPTMTPRAT